MTTASASYGNAAFALLPAFDMPAANHEARADILSRNAENGRQPPISGAVLVEHARRIYVECRGFMSAMVRRGVHHFKVFNPIVGLVAIPVVDMHTRQKGAPKMLFHDVSVFIDRPAIDADDPVSRDVEAMLELPGTLATLVAKRPLSRPKPAGKPCELSATRRACAFDVHSRKVPCPLIDGKPLTKAERKAAVAAMLAGGMGAMGYAGTSEAADASR